jgi:hypothetical protein
VARQHGLRVTIHGTPAQAPDPRPYQWRRDGATREAYLRRAGLGVKRLTLQATVERAP